VTQPRLADPRGGAPRRLVPAAAGTPALCVAARENRRAWALMAPALLALAAVALFPLLVTLWESLHLRDLRMPWRGHPWVGLGNYAEALGDPRVHAAAAHTAFFAAVSVALELALGLGLALALHGSFRGRGLARTSALLPWALPTVVSALLWRFFFEGPASVASALASALGAQAPAWLADPRAVWVPLILADVWKTTPFVALLLLAGLQAIDPALYEAARVDGAGPWQRFRHVTLPLLAPALSVAALFRALDALRVFDLVYVLSGGGPGTASEPLALYGFGVLFRDLRFGFGAALSLLIFGMAFALAWLYVRFASAALLGERDSG
jgi:ABC-type sugar transport system permease subunit